MRFVNADGRSGLLVDGQVFDLERASGGAISSDPMAVILERAHWDAALALHAAGVAEGGVPVGDVRLGPPVPAPRAVYGVGLNYKAHAAESGAEHPSLPAIFTKFPTSITGPHDPVILPTGTVMNDWEAELAFVLADGPRRLPAERAFDHILGYLCAQDISERMTQFAAGAQFSMGKSFDTFCPIGPAIVTLDEVPDPLRLRITCTRNGEVVQDATSDDMIFDVPRLVEFISSVCPLRAGDLCLTGTPAGVGVARKPPVFLQPGDVIETEIEGLGTLRNECVAE